MARAYADKLPVICANHLPERVICCGGVSWKNPELLQVMEETMGIPCVRSSMPHEALNGLYRLPLAATGCIKSLTDRPDCMLLTGDKKM